MSTLLKYCLFVVVLLMGSGAFAQTFAVNEPSENEAQYTLQNTTNNPDFNPNRVATVNNSVFINQIGDFNDAVVNAQANDLSIEIVQQGDDNNVYLNSRALSIDQKVIQQGNNHNFVDFSYSSNIHNLELIQTGNSQNLILYGENSISENMKIRMDGDSQSLVVRNFN